MTDNSSSRFNFRNENYTEPVVQAGEEEEVVCWSFFLSVCYRLVK